MARYQIRTPENKELEDIIQTMATKSWEILKAWNAFQRETTQENFEEYRRTLYLQMVPFVRAYKLCGLSNICVDELRSTPWAPETHVLDASPTDLVYHLFPGKGLEEFLEGLAVEALESVKCLIKPDFETETLSILRASYRTILGEYLYLNPVCGKTELCVYSSSAPVKPWDREKR